LDSKESWFERTTKFQILENDGFLSADKVPDKLSSVPSLSSEQPSTSEAENGNKSAPKVIKIVSNKARPDDGPVESHKVNFVIRPPSEAGKFCYTTTK